MVTVPLPSFIEGLSPEDILLTDDNPTRLVELYGHDAAVSMVTLRYERQQLLRLLQGDLVPTTEQAVFMAEVEQGVPIQINDNGLTLRKTPAGWLCEMNGVDVTGLCSSPAEALYLQAELG